VAASTALLEGSTFESDKAIRCRRAIDEAGRCLPADVFVVLPNDVIGDAVLEDIKRDMPGIKLQSWNVELESERARKVRRGTSHERLLIYMSAVMPGKHSMSEIRNELLLGKKQKAHLMEVLRDVEHPLVNALNAMGVRYVTTGSGGNRRSFLEKVDVE